VAYHCDQYGKLSIYENLAFTLTHYESDLLFF
jgi:hypothetical protein